MKTFRYLNKNRQDLVRPARRFRLEQGQRSIGASACQDFSNSCLLDFSPDEVALISGLPKSSIAPSGICLRGKEYKEDAYAAIRDAMLREVARQLECREKAPAGMNRIRLVVNRCPADGRTCRTPLEFSPSRQIVAASPDDVRLCGLVIMRPCKAGKNGFDP